MPRFETHSHTHYSNIRLRDCIIKPKILVDYARELGLSGICITDHECLSGHIELNILQEEIQKEDPDFKIGLGNEIYLCGSRENGQKYYHFILIAKNMQGHKALRELSSKAWMNSYWDRGMERVVTLYSDLEEIVNKYPNSLIAATACLGGELSTAIMNLHAAEQTHDEAGAAAEKQHIVGFISWCKNLFGSDFYIECAPGKSREQIIANKRLNSIAQCFNIPMIIGTDAHYLKKEDRYIHKAYLTSKEGEREVDAFYEYSYLQNEEEIYKNLQPAFTNQEITNMFMNSLEIYAKIENYSLQHKQQIPKVEVQDYPKSSWWGVNNPHADDMSCYPILQSMFTSDDQIERYWINKCWESLEEKKGPWYENLDYVARLEEEADIKRTISEKLETNMFAYPVTLQHYVDLFWECGSIVGAGRGSSCSGLNHYLLGITQLDPLQWNLPFWRYLNKDRAELGDIDLDLCPSRRPLILSKIREERGSGFREDIDDLSRKNLGCTLIATFGTETAKSAILTACRGYRSEECPDGIDIDTAQYLAALVPIERGFPWELREMVEGNPDKDRKPVKLFVNEIRFYPGLLDIMLGIEGLINKRSSHASGVILNDEDPYEYGCYMKTPKGVIITQYDLHMAEAAGATKYDFLVTEVQDKLREAIRLMQEDEVISSGLTLRQVYEQYFHPNVLPIEEDKYWKVLQENSVLNIFQFDSDVGSQAAKKIKPSSILEMADANGLMRLMTAEKGEETPMEKYIRFKNNINLWYKEMRSYGLTTEEQEVLKPYFLKSHGVPPSQEQLMMMLMDPQICNFTLADANAARKIVGKKQMSKIPALRKQVLDQAASPCLGNYIWKHGVGPQMGYSFSIIHALAYSFIGFQTMYIATRWNPIYWNTACLIVNSGALGNFNEEDEYDDEEQAEKSTDYTKLAKALGDILSKGIQVSLVDINHSDYSFKPDIDNNQILFGMKALGGVSGATIEQILLGRPYTSFSDFLQRCPLNKTAMISLIKAGAFDKLEKEWAAELNVEPRYLIMAQYIYRASEPKSKLNLQNFNGLIQRGLIPQELDFQKRVFEFNKYLKANTKVGKYYVFDQACETFYTNYFDLEHMEIINGFSCILQTKWDKLYQKEMDIARDWLKLNQEEVLKLYNASLFEECWNKYAKGTLSSWEMEALCFYYHEHELANVNMYKYGIDDFFMMPTTPEVDYFFQRNGKQIPIYKTYKIIGTVISKNDTKATISLLTPTGVVSVKFTKEYYAMFARQLSERQEDGSKKVVEKGWFKRGTKLLITGFRRDDQFVAKTYAKTTTHQIYKLDTENNGKDLIMTHERYQVNEDNE